LLVLDYGDVPSLWLFGGFLPLALYPKWRTSLFGHDLIGVSLHHAFESAFQIFAHAVAAAHNAFHDAELFHVAG
jgi:hypothetical protein